MFSPRHVILLQPVIFRRNQAILRGVMTSYWFLRWRPWRQKSIFGFRFSDGTCWPICMPNFDKISQCTAEIKLLTFSKNGRPPYWNCTSAFDFDRCIVIGMSFCSHLPNFIATDDWRRSYDVISIFQDGGHKIKNLLPGSGFVLAHSFKKLDIYLLAKFWWNISIHGYDKITSGFEKRTVAILELYFRYPFLPNFRHRRVILHWPTKFRQNRATLGGVMTSYRFFQDGCRQPYWIWSG